MSLWTKLFGDQPQHTTDTPEQIRARIANQQALMLDVRSLKEWNDGHLKDAIFIPITDIKSLPETATEVAGLPKDLIIYCH